MAMLNRVASFYRDIYGLVKKFIPIMYKQANDICLNKTYENISIILNMY